MFPVQNLLFCYLLTMVYLPPAEAQSLPRQNGNSMVSKILPDLALAPESFTFSRSGHYFPGDDPAETLKDQDNHFTVSLGAITRADSTKKQLTLVFTGHEYAEGTGSILQTLEKEGLKAAFFLTGDFVRKYPEALKQMLAGGHYVGAHSDKHLLYCDWTHRDSLLVTKQQFQQDLLDNYKALAPFGVTVYTTPFFLPPYEWYNQQVASWTKDLGLTLINNTSGTLSAADYTTLKDHNYRDNETIHHSIINKARLPNGLNGYLLLLHIGAGPERPEKYYEKLPALIQFLKQQDYALVSLNSLLNP